jgi:hypothetical protein
LNSKKRNKKVSSKKELINIDKKELINIDKKNEFQKDDK